MKTYLRNSIALHPVAYITSFVIMMIILFNCTGHAIDDMKRSRDHESIIISDTISTMGTVIMINEDGNVRYEVYVEDYPDKIIPFFAIDNTQYKNGDIINITYVRTEMKMNSSTIIECKLL